MRQVLRGVNPALTADSGLVWGFAKDISKTGKAGTTQLPTILLFHQW